MKTPYSPGPWRAQGNVIFSSDIGSTVCKLFALGYIRESANARLIAAAPELLAALKYTVAILDGQEHPLAQTFRDVIAKAEGKS